MTSWSRVLLEKLTGSQLVKKFPAFYGTRRFFEVTKPRCVNQITNMADISQNTNKIYEAFKNTNQREE